MVLADASTDICLLSCEKKFFQTLQVREAKYFLYELNLTQHTLSLFKSKNGFASMGF